MSTSVIPAAAAHARPLSREQEVRAAQVRLLYSNTNLGVAVTLFATALLALKVLSTVTDNSLLA